MQLNTSLRGNENEGQACVVPSPGRLGACWPLERTRSALTVGHVPGDPWLFASCLRRIQASGTQWQPLPGLTFLASRADPV